MGINALVVPHAINMKHVVNNKNVLSCINIKLYASLIKCIGLLGKAAILIHLAKKKWAVALNVPDTCSAKFFP